MESLTAKDKGQSLDSERKEMKTYLDCAINIALLTVVPELIAHLNHPSSDELIYSMPIRGCPVSRAQKIGEFAEKLISRFQIIRAGRKKTVRMVKKLPATVTFARSRRFAAGLAS